MSEITLSENEKSKFGEILNHVHDWCSKNQWAVGIGEMAAGAGIIAAGVQIGNIHMGRDLLGTKLEGFDMEALGESAFDGGAQALAGTILNSIGTATGGGGIGIPAWLLISGGGAIFGAAGYAIKSTVHDFLHPPIDVEQFFVGASLLAIGTALLIDGAQRLMTDKSFKRRTNAFRDGVVHLKPLTVEVVAGSFDALKSLVVRMSPTGPVDTAGSVTTGVAGAAAGAVIGSGVAAGSVTVLGSQAIGGLALSLGLVSAPLWPVIAGGAAGLAVGFSAWRAVSYYGNYKFIRHHQQPSRKGSDAVS